MKIRILSLGLASLLPFSTPSWATLANALNTGNPAALSDVTENNITSAALSQISTYQTKQNQMLGGIYSTDTVSYTPGNRSQFTSITENEAVFPLLVGSKGNTLGAYGTAGSGRFAAYGFNPMTAFVTGSNLGYENAFKRVVGWLMSGTAGDISNLSVPKNVALTYTGGSGENTKITSWFSQKAPTWRTKVCNDPATIATCYQSQDLLIVSWESGTRTAAQDAAVLAAIKTHLQAGKPVLYLHTWYEATSNFSTILSTFLGFSLPYGGNYWANDAANFTGWATMQQARIDPFAAMKTLLTHFQNQDYTFNWTLCTDDRNCKNMPDLVSEFYNGAEAVKQQVATWETQNLDVFSQIGSRPLAKMMVLLGDKYRATIKYPMQKGLANNTTFLKALYADHSAYIIRNFNPGQTDLGSFSAPLPALMTGNATLQSSSLSSTASSTSGYYARPGQTVTLTRSDSQAVKAYAHINMLRTGAAHVFATYDRPMFLWSEKIPLVAGKPVKITTPYGGILFVNTEGTTSPQAVQVAATNVAQMATFTGSNLSEFNTLLTSTPLNWAEFKFPGIEIHSRMDLMRLSISDPLIGGNLSRLVDLTQNYLYKDIYSLAGMVSASLSQPQKVVDFCTAHGWNCTNTAIHGTPNVQHVNADRANCGYGCSGNPYDQYWAFSPLGWGESHEIGHNLQRGRLKIYDSASTEVSNNIFPIHKWWLFNQVATETTKYGRSLGFKATFDALQLAAKSANPVETARLSVWVNGDVFQRLIFYWQMAMSSQNLAQLGDKGWDLFRLMYIQERLFSNAIANDTDWANQRAGLGFSQYSTRTAASSITSNDYMLVSMSYITGRDQRPFFNMWGVTYSAAASAQVATYGFPAAAKQFWVVQQEDKAFKDPLPASVKIDGVSAWPI